MHDLAAILRAVLAGYALPARGQHGVAHWARVFENGQRVAATTGADAEVVALFALFHDSRRESESYDRDHGRRGGDFARSLRGDLVHLDDARFELLFDACDRHTDGHTTGDPTLLACWDADRLDLGRVGIRPRADRLGTDAGRALIPWASARSVAGHEPPEVFAAWGVAAE